MEINCGSARFWVHPSKDEKKSLTRYWACMISEKTKTKWFFFAPDEEDDKYYEKKGDFYSWWVKYPFYAETVPETIYYVTNKEWQCTIQEDVPYLQDGYVKGFGENDHWKLKKFQAYNCPVPGTVAFRCGQPVVQFWAYKGNNDQNLTHYYALSIEPKWWIVSLSDTDLEEARKSGFWGWNLQFSFWAKKIEAE